MNSVRIRCAISREQEELEALQWRASLSNAGDRNALLANPDALELPIEQIEKGWVFVAEWNGVIVGFSAVLPRTDGETELDALFVEPTIQRRGIGRLLVEHCADVALAQGSTALHVVGNPHAESFYLACGFEMTGMTETRFGTGLLLQKILASDSAGLSGV